MDKVLFGIYEEYTKDAKGEKVPNRVFIGADGLPTHIKREPIASVVDSDDAEVFLEVHKAHHLSQKILSCARYPDRYEIKLQGENK